MDDHFPRSTQNHAGQGRQPQRIPPQAHTSTPLLPMQSYFVQMWSVGQRRGTASSSIPCGRPARLLHHMPQQGAPSCAPPITPASFPVLGCEASTADHLGKRECSPRHRVSRLLQTGWGSRHLPSSPLLNPDGALGLLDPLATNEQRARCPRGGSQATGICKMPAAPPALLQPHLLR